MSVNHPADDFSTPNPHRSQERRILDALLTAKGTWVSAQTLSEISLQYGSRIHTIRKTLGFNVENKVERTPSGGKRGYYRIRQFVSFADGKLLSTPARTQPEAQPQIAEHKPAEIAPLFPDGLAPSHRDDG